MPRPRPSLIAHAVVTTAAAVAVALATVLPAVSAEPSITSASPAAPSADTTSSVATVSGAAAPTVVTPVRPAAVTLAAAAGRSSAMRNALSKIGARYRYGAAGPSAFDCSGLVYWSYRQAGVTLPRTSRAMSGVGTPVARGDLQPGDLVFFYRPVSHVAIYIGGGEVVHASTYGQPVKIAPLGGMPFTTARRI